MYGLIGYGTQTYGSFKQFTEEGGRDITITGSEFVIRGAGRTTTFAIVKTVSRIRSFMKREFLRFRPKTTD